MTAARADLDAGVRAAVEACRRAGPLPFGQTFLPHLVSGAPSPLHHELNAWHLRELNQPPGAMDAFAAPRGHGKSTMAVEIATLWHAAYEARRYIVIASDTWSQARERLLTIITEIEENDELRYTFPGLRPARDTLNNLVAWRDDDIALANGTRIVGVGAGKSIRGAKMRDRRPDLLLLDDLEDEESVASIDALARRLRWITRVALGLAGPMRGISALWVGTILSRSALLNQATGAALDEGQVRPAWAKAWTPHVYRAELDGTERVETVVIDTDTNEPVTGDAGAPLTFLVGEPMWSELDRTRLASIRFKIGPVSYAAEYLSDPVDEATSLLAPPRPAHYVNPDASPLGRIIRLPDGRLVPVTHLTRAAALDPQYALPRPGQADPDLAAICVAGQYGADTFLLDCWIGRDRHGQARRLVDLAERWGCYCAGVEANGAQVLTADDAAQLARIPIVPMRSAKGKTERAKTGTRTTGATEHALGLAVRLGDPTIPETCRVYVLPEAEALVEYLTAFPNGRFDDPVDATVFAVELAARMAGPARDSQAGADGPRAGGAR